MNDQPLLDRAAPRVALVTCAQVPDLDADTRKLLGPLEAAGWPPSRWCGTTRR